MNRLLIASLCALATACAQQAARPPEPQEAQKTVDAPVLKSGLELGGFDRSVRPQDDLFRFANGQWLKTTEIPPDRSNFGTFEALDARAEEDVRRIAAEAAAVQAAPGSDTQRIGDFYKSFMDTATLEKLGATPLQPELARIAKIRTSSDVVRHIGYSQRIGVNHPLRYFVGQDARDSSSYLAGVTQSGLTMPDRDYYLKGDQKYQDLRAGLERYIGDMLALAGVQQPAEAAKHIMAIEMKVATAHWTRVKNRDPVATYNKVSVAEGGKLAPGFDWQAFFEGAGAPAGVFDVNQPSYVEALGGLVRSVPVEHWREYFTFHLVDEYAPYLSQAFVDKHFDFHQRQLRGVQEQKARWKRAVQMMNNLTGELVGKAYVKEHFSSQSKERVRAIVANLVKAFDQSIDELEWMTPATRAEAKKKLSTFAVKVGYPDKWRDYSTLTLSPTDLAGNVMRAVTFDHEYDVAKLGKPLDRTEWLMAPQRVNAYYYPPMNEIVFPAAILQPPFFDPDADDAVNYGGIGAVIGHEISHGFDDSGRQFDGTGNLRDWWVQEDSERFKQRAGKLAAQYSSYTVLDSQPLNGELTLGENIGDLSGLTVAYRAYELSLAGKEPPVIDGFTGPQRFFLGWAQVWRRKYRDEELRMRLMTDPHSPSEFRSNGVVTNMPEFYEAFAVKEGDRLYRPSPDRVRIW